MRKQLFIQLPQNGGASAPKAASWVVRDVDKPAGTLFQGDLHEAATQAVGARVSVLVPGEEAVLAQVEMPAMKGQRLARAIPFALEDQLAEDVEALHVAIGQRDGQGRVANVIVNRVALDGWLAQLKEAGLHPDVISPELFGVPWDLDSDDYTWSMVVNDTQILLRTGEQTGVTFERRNILPMLRACIDESGEVLPKSISVASCGDHGFEDSEAHQQLLELCEEHNIELRLRQQDEVCSVLLAQGFNEQSAINLLQGDYSRKEQLEKLFRPWRPAFIVAAVWLLLQAGMFVAEYSRLSGLAVDQKTQIESLFRQAFPEARNIVNPQVQMERGLEKLRGGGADNEGFLSLLAQTGAVLKDTPGAQLRTLRFKANKLDLDLDMPDLQALDKLKQRLIKQAKLKVDIVSASSREGKVESRLSIQGGGK